METKNNLEKEVMSVELIEINTEKGKNTRKLIINDLNKMEIDLTDNDTKDIQIFFNSIYTYIIEKEKLIKFELIDNNKRDLFYEVSVELIEHINYEIEQSETNFIELIEQKVLLGSL